MATSPEVLAIERVHQAAQARLGIAAAYLALAKWSQVSTLNAEAGSAAWLLLAVRTVTASRKMSRKLAISYYQLVRALETGATLGEPIASPATDVTIRDLRATFREYALDVAAFPSPLTRDDDPDIRWFEEQLREEEMPEATTPDRLIRLADAEVEPLIQELLDVEESAQSNKPVKIDEHDWEPEMSFEDVDRMFRELLRKQSIELSVTKTKALRASEELSPEQALTQIEKSHATAGSTGSGTVDYLGMEGGRQAIDAAITVDKRIKIIARGTSGDPCSFCAMLAARGFVYTSDTSGVGDTIGEDGTLSISGTLSQDIKMYHTNCHCFPIVRFVNESDTLPPLSKYFQEMWPEVTDGYSGNDARKAWRRWIYAQRKANPDNPHGI